jgi:hypothetical protein
MLREELGEDDKGGKRKEGRKWCTKGRTGEA